MGGPVFRALVVLHVALPEGVCGACAELPPMCTALCSGDAMLELVQMPR